jgi:hypothetical protein
MLDRWFRTSYNVTGTEAGREQGPLGAEIQSG